MPMTKKPAAPSNEETRYQSARRPATAPAASMPRMAVRMATTIEPVHFMLTDNLIRVASPLGLPPRSLARRCLVDIYLVIQLMGYIGSHG
jgi:hypothetical protein